MSVEKIITIDDETYDVTNEFLSQVLQTAAEGGCSSWADVSVDEQGDERGEDGRGNFSAYAEEDEESESDAAFYTSASFLVSKDPSQGGTIDLQGIADAIERIANNEVEIAPAIRDIIIAAVENDDATDIDSEAADCIVQVGLFDEIVYG